jgi:hypothetical protein
MNGTASAVALVVVSLIALFAVVAVIVWARTLATRPGPFLAFATAAATAALFSSLLYLLYFSFEPFVWTLALGDMSMVWGPGFLWVALGALNGRRRWQVWLVLAAGAAVAAVTLTTPEDTSSSVKIAVLVAACIAGTVEACLRPARSLRGILWIGVTLAVYGAYCVGRLVTAAVGGTRTGPYATYFSTDVTTIVGVMAVVLVAYGVVRAARDPRLEVRAQEQSVRDRLVAHARDLIAPGATVVWRDVSLQELSLIRDSFGDDYVAEAHIALLTACRDAVGDTADVGAVGTGHVVIVEPDGGAAVARADLRARFARASEIVRDTYVPDLDIVSTRVGSHDELTSLITVP